MSDTNQRKEEMEGQHVAFFLNLYNADYHTDYEIGEVEEQNSIIDRKAVSSSGKYPDLLFQLKSLKERDVSPLTKSIMGKTLVFDTNIFKLLDKKLEDLKNFDGRGIVLILETAVSMDWVRDYEPKNDLLESLTFDSVYLFALPSSLDPKGFIYKLK